MNIIIYENERKKSTNQLFFYELNFFFPNWLIQNFARVDLFEKQLQKTIFDAFILDVMGNETDLKGSDGKVSRTNIGMELLKRLRKKHYPKQKTYHE